MITICRYFRYQGEDGLNIARGLAELELILGELSMPDLRKVVVTCFSGSYAGCVRFVAKYQSESLEFSEHEVELVMSLLVAVSRLIDESRLRKIMSWCRPLLEEARMNGSDPISEHIEDVCEIPIEMVR